MRTRMLLLLFSPLGALFSSAGCSDRFGTCTTDRTCSARSLPDAGAPPEGGASHAGNGGNSATAGISNGGTSTDSGGAANAGDAGAGGTTSSVPCDGACSGTTPRCDELSDTCVECLNANDCDGNDKACDADTHQCVGCLDSDDCTADAPTCDIDAQTCVECLESTDCKDEKAAKCAAKSCEKCTSNQDCAHIAGKTVCDTAAGECVQCTGQDFSACGASMGTPLVCDTLKRTCSNNKEKSAGLCQPCVSDAQCSAGKLCVNETFGTPAKDVGYFCFWRKGDTANGAPSTCLPGANPYAKTLTNQISIEGVTADICGLRSSTCTARNQFSAKDCATSMAADDQKCGFSPGLDSKCAQADIGVYRCTMTCGSDDDCPNGFPCNTGANPAVCGL